MADPGSRFRRASSEPASPLAFSSEVSCLLDQLWPLLLRWTHRQLPPRARRRMDTGDLIQEALVGALLHMPELELRSPAEVRAYIQKSIRNRIRDEIRRSRVGEAPGESPDEAAPSHEPSPLEQAIQLEDDGRLRSACERLDPRDRELIIGRLELGHSYEELAVATGRPTAEAARVATRRAVLRLRRILAETPRLA